MKILNAHVSQIKNVRFVSFDVGQTVSQDFRGSYNPQQDKWNPEYTTTKLQVLRYPGGEKALKKIAEEMMLTESLWELPYPKEFEFGLEKFTVLQEYERQ